MIRFMLVQNDEVYIGYKFIFKTTKVLLVKFMLMKFILTKFIQSKSEG